MSLLQRRHDTVSRAILAGALDLVRRRPPVGRLTEDDRLDGRRCLVTGANSGLGKAVARELVRRGAALIMGCRTLDEGARRDVAEAAPRSDVKLAQLDMASFDSVKRFCRGLRRTGQLLDLAVLNAGVVASHGRRTGDGFEEMFQVNYLANVLLVETLFEQGIIRIRGHNSLKLKHSSGDTARRDRGSRGDRHRQVIPRIVFVSSESHRTARPPDLEHLGRFEPYAMSRTMAEYGKGKLLLSTYAAELARRCDGEHGPEVSVHSLCPGAVNTGIAREAPAWARPLLRLTLPLFFRSPKRAAEPVVFLACSKQIEGKTGIYLHLLQQKPASAWANSPQNGARLRQISQRLLEQGPPR